MLKQRNVLRLASLLLGFFLCMLLLGTPSQGLTTNGTIVEDPFTSAALVNLADGTYLVEVTLEGGSGRASVTSPATVEVRSGKAVATIEWSSPNYDYMIVGGLTYLPFNLEGNSTFQIPILSADGTYPVIGDTTAMSQPHEIDYLLSFDLAHAKAVIGEQSPSAAMYVVPLVAVCAVSLVVVVLVVRKKGSRA